MSKIEVLLKRQRTVCLARQSARLDPELARRHTQPLTNLEA